MVAAVNYFVSYNPLVLTLWIKRHKIRSTIFSCDPGFITNKKEGDMSKYHRSILPGWILLFVLTISLAAPVPALADDGQYEQ